MPNNQIYPRKAFINAITNAQNAVLTFTAAHDFTLGELVSIRVRPDFGMFQINNKVGRILATGSTTITLDIDSSSWDPFDYSSLDSAGTTPPVCVPCCSGKIQGTKPAQINQKAAFDNRRV